MTTSPHPTTDPGHPTDWSATRVLATRPLRPGTVLEDTAQFRDDTWPLLPALLRMDARPHTLDFTAVPAPFRPTAKLLLLRVLLNPTVLPPGETPLAISSINTVLGNLRRFFTWLQPRQHTLGTVTAEILQAYHQDLVADRRSRVSVTFHRRCVRMLWLYRDHLGADHLTQDPYRLPAWRAWARVHRSRHTENSTERIPEQVAGPLLTWALRWVDDFAPDVLPPAPNVTPSTPARPPRLTQQTPSAISSRHSGRGGGRCRAFPRALTRVATAPATRPR